MTEDRNPSQKSRENESRAQYLTFHLGEEEYGIEILRVQEIKRYPAVTPIPNSPPHIKGVMNLRGSVVPILDLRTRFGLPAVEHTRFTVIIVVTVGTKVVGLVVDSVSDVLAFTPSQIEPPPQLAMGAKSSFLTGMAKHDERLISLLEIDAVAERDDTAVAVEEAA